ncbi:PREDICTED: putative nuclease HARBI1 [Camelina sativa]|uniref:Nuclease HARBI1 n=1 Tax=Camelina sativa TaxID=90675 RepID=A0ABM0WXS9_CAMSA|nr:PREDICTED: putative nuclease HARBI1 [Camelina sativa]
MLEDDEAEDGSINFGESFMDPYSMSIERRPMNEDPERGRRYVYELIHGHEKQCYDIIRMYPPVYIKLCEKLKEDHHLMETDEVSIQESVAIFLTICAQNGTQRYVGKIFGHSQETIGRKFHEVLNALEHMAVELLRPGPEELNQPHPKLQSDRRYWPYFRGFIGAIDGTHVPVTVAGKNSEKYWNRKSGTSMNILAICNMDMLFTYAYIGIPGSAHDAKVLMLAMEGNHQFPTPPMGKYYLGDSGYALRPGFLTPYRGERYHPSEYNRARPPSSHKEMFNKRHSSLRSVIERTFGVWKAKWRVLREKPRYAIHVQRKVIAATMALHNFIRLSNLRDVDFDSDRIASNIAEEDSDSDEELEQNNTPMQYMEGIRDEISASLWSSR